jgi:betaine-aldehyde dehydrogenase
MATPASVFRSTELNKQSSSRRNDPSDGAGTREVPEEARRQQLIEVTIDSLADVGYVGSTLAQIAQRAGVSPGLVAHYFDDKDGLLEATFRTLARGIGERMRERLRRARTPRGRVQAVIDTNLAPEEFDQRTGTAWLAFWGQVLHVKGLKRVQTVYQRRMLSNLRHALRRLVPADEAHSLAAMIAAMIDGVWLRAALSRWQEADSETARAMLTDFVDSRLQKSSRPETGVATTTGGAGVCSPRPVGSGRGSFKTINPATGEVLAEIAVDGPAEVAAAVARASAAQKEWASLPGVARGRILRRAADILRARTPSSRSWRRATPVSPSRRRARSMCSPVPTVSNTTRVSPRASRASTWTSGRRRSAIRGASRSVSSRASAPGTTRCRSPVGKQRRRSPAAMP